MAILPFVPAIAAGANLISGIFKNKSENNNIDRRNAEERAYNDMAYERQKKDNLEFWNMQNDYNSPQAQMKRYQEAGLNPNLVYGSAGQSAAGSIDSAKAMPYAPQERKAFNAPQVFETYQNMAMQQANIDNVKTQGNILKAEAQIKSEEAARSIALNNYFLGRDSKYAESGLQRFVYSDEFKMKQLHENFLGKSADNQWRYGDSVYGKGMDMKGSFSDLQSRNLRAGAKLRDLEVSLKKEFGKKGMQLDYDINSIRKNLAQKDLDVYGYGKAADIGVNLLRLIFKR